MEVDMFGRIQIIIIGGMLLLGALTGIYYSWRSSIEREALLEYNQKQLEQSIKDKEELKQKMDLIEIDQQAAIRKIEEDRKALEEQGLKVDEKLVVLAENQDDFKKLIGKYLSTNPFLA